MRSNTARRSPTSCSPFTSQARNFLVGFIVLLGIVAVLLISNTIRLSIFARKREVEIMKLVGATNWFIRWPFIIEGVTVGLVGAILASVVVLVVNSFLVGKIRDSLTFMTVPLNAVPYVAGGRHPARCGRGHRGRRIGHRSAAVPQGIGDFSGAKSSFLRCCEYRAAA